MKKITSALLYLLFALTVFFPMGTMIAACFGYGFQLISVPAFAIAIGGLFFCTMILDILFKNEVKHKTLQIFSALLCPLSMINAVFFIFVDPQLWVIGGIFLSVACSCYFAIKHGKSKPLKIVTLTLSAVMLLPMVFFSFFAFIFGNIGNDTVTETLSSPTGKYCAQVVARSEGALGGSTVVDVYEVRKSVDLFLFKIEKKPQQVYYGDWGEYANMKISWKDDQSLVINSGTYEIE